MISSDAEREDSLVLHQIYKETAYDLTSWIGQDKMARVSSVLQNAVMQCLEAERQGHSLRHVQGGGGGKCFNVTSVDYNKTQLGRQFWALNLCMVEETDNSPLASVQSTVERPNETCEEEEDPQTDDEKGSVPDVPVSEISTAGDGNSIEQAVDLSQMNRPSGG
jgi:hypothetical protein